MLNREDALKICEVVLAHAKAAGADDANVSVQSSVASHARFADNRVTTSGRSDDLGITATVWTGRRRGAATGNDAGDAALKQLADDAVSIARVSPVQREYVPTLGPLDYAEGRAFVAATADPDLAARATALEAVLAACRTAKVTGAGFHNATASATAVATANGNRRYFRTSEGALSITARTPTGPAPATSPATTSTWPSSTRSTSSIRRWVRPCARDRRSRSSPVSIRSFSNRKRWPI